MTTGDNQQSQSQSVPLANQMSVFPAYSSKALKALSLGEVTPNDTNWLNAMTPCQPGNRERARHIPSEGQTEKVHALLTSHWTA